MNYDWGNCWHQYLSQRHGLVVRVMELERKELCQEEEQVCEVM